MKSHVTILRQFLKFFKFFCIFLILGILLPACEDRSFSSEKNFRIALSAEPPTLDWSLATDSVSFDILTNIMEGLTQYNEKLEPIPAIAASWEFSKDKRTITYYLRDDVFWTDGKKVTASDFEYSWKRLLNPDTAAEYAYFLFDVVNAEAYNSGKVRNPDAVGVRALSPRVLEVRLKRPVIYFPSITTFMVTFPQREDIVTRYGDHWTDPEHIVTNGPFTLNEWRHEYKLVLGANSGYYADPPGIDRITAFIVEERTTALTLYETGELDMVQLPPVAIPHYQDHLEYMNMPLLRGYYYGFTVSKPPFDDHRVRQAFACAIDRSQFPVILKGGEIPTSSWIPKGMFGYNPEIGSHFDPVIARQLLAEAGYPNGKGLPPVAAVYNTTQVNRLIAEFLQGQWKKHLNVPVRLETQEWKVFLSRLKIDPPQIFRLGWGADFPDPDNFMNLFLSNSGNNRLRWANPEYDRLVAEGASERNLYKRQAIYDAAQRILTEIDVPMIPLYIQTVNLLVKSYVKGFQPNAMELLYLKYIDFDFKQGHT